MPRPEVEHRIVRYPGGLTVQFRWSGSGRADEVFALTGVGGPLVDHGPLVSPTPDRLCRAEMRVESPGGTWTARFASPIFDEPKAYPWDTAGLLVVGYGLRAYALEARTGDLQWVHAGGTPLVEVLGSARLPHVIVQSEIDTVAIDADGERAWRLAHRDVVVAAELVAGRLVLTSAAGTVAALDPLTGRTLE